MADAKKQPWGWPRVALFTSTAPSASAHNLDTTTDGCAWIFATETTDPITHVGFLYGTRTGSGAITYTVGLESVSASTGLPSGTYLQSGGVDCKVTFTPSTTSSMNNLWQKLALDQAYTPAATGEVVALTVRYATGVTASEYSSIVTHDSSPSLEYASFSRPYASRLTSGTWANQSGMPIYAVYTSSTCYGRPYQSLYSTATSSTVGRRVAAAITLPTTHGDTFQLGGFTAVAQLATASGKAPKAGIWAASGGSLQSAIVDVDQLRVAGGSARNLVEVTFTSAVTLNHGTQYYAGFEVNDAASAGITLWGTQYGSSGEIEAEPYGADFCLATFDGSNWTKDSTVRPYLKLHPIDLTVPSGGSGGLIIHPGMGGGMRG